MTVKENHILSEAEITKFNKGGMKLDPSKKKMYTLKFMFNGKLNNAADPRPFKLNNLEMHAKRAIGRPWVVPPFGQKKHIRAKLDTSEALLEHQAKFSIGDIVNYIKAEHSDNYYAIVDVWPEFQGAVSNDLIPPFTSPTFHVNKEGVDGIEDADFINIQTVPHPGYEPEFAGITAVCNDGLNRCMTELKTVAAAGNLEKIRKDSKSFSSMMSKIIGAMSTENNQSGADPSNKEVIAAVEKLEGEVKAVEVKVDEVKKVEEKIVEVVKEVATEAEGVDETKIKEKLDSEASPGSDKPTEPKPETETVGAAGKHNSATIQKLESQNSALEKELNTIKTERAAEKKAAEDKERKAQATKIVEALLKLKDPEVTLEKKDEHIQNYIDLKDSNDNPRDLSLLVETFESKLSKIVGAAGNAVYDIPEMTSDGSNTHSNLEIMEAKII